MYALDIRPSLDRKFRKMARRNRALMEIIFKKADEIVREPHHYEPLRAPLNGWRRVHIDTNFVLAFSIDEKSQTVILEDFDHHDKIYRD